jgi:succinoglycan biosynthesis protein ExoM
MRIAICVITYMRPDGLHRLLESLNSLEFKKFHKPDISIIVVDNDELGSARSICDKFSQAPNHPLIYDIEARRGIPYARNKCLSIAKSNYDCMAFIDDDEIAESIWLDELLFVYERDGAAIVAGPVLPHFLPGTPDWILQGKFFDYPRHSTGFRPVIYPETGNVLIDCSILNSSGVVFDERMVLTGGSDACFFTVLHNAGHEAVWSNEAIAHEWIPKSRANIKWLIKRSFRVGSNLSFIDRNVDPSKFPTKFVARVLKAARRIVFGTLLFPFSLVLGKKHSYALLQFIAKGVGMLAGLVNVSYNEYKTIHKV